MIPFVRTAFIATISYAALVVLPLPSHAEEQLASAAHPGEIAIESLTDTYTYSPGQWRLNVGFDFSRGDYGATQPTDVYYSPIGMGYRQGRWDFSVDTGFLKVKGPVDYASILDLSTEDITALGLDTETIAVNGIADVIIGARYTAIENFENGIFVDLGARLKVPTASRNKGLGNGKVTGDLQVDLTKLVGSWSVFVSGSYGFRSHENDGRDVLAASFGVGRSLTERLAVGAVFDWRTSVRRGGHSGREAIIYGSYNLSQTVSVTTYAVFGFSPASVNQSFGVRFTYRWP